jgi:hypothetical protein
MAYRLSLILKVNNGTCTLFDDGYADKEKAKIALQTIAERVNDEQDTIITTPSNHVAFNAGKLLGVTLAKADEW